MKRIVSKINVLIAALAMSLGIHAATPPTGSQTYYGLFVGVNEFSDANYLYGCDWDAMRLMDAYTRGGFCDVANAELVANLDATKDVVRAKFNALAATAKAGDTVFYYQSSHGGDYDSDKGSYLCLTDDNWYDTEFAEDLAKFADGVRVIVVLDACFSGGMFKSANGGAAAGKNTTKWNFAANVRRQLIARRSSKKGVPSVAWITAAEWNEVSLMDERGSEFTHALLSGWEDGSADEDSDGYVSFGELSEYAKDEVSGSAVQSDNDELLGNTVAGQEFDIDTFRLLSANGTVYGFLGECPSSIVIPEGTKALADGAFSAEDNDVFALETVTLSDAMETIGFNAFYGCDGLTEITIPASVVLIDECAFMDCSSLETVTFVGDRDAVEIRFDAFAGTPYLSTLPFKLLIDDGWLYGFEGTVPSEVVVPDTVWGIAESLFDAEFHDVEALTSVTIPASVEEIYAYAFYDCENLATVTFEGDIADIWFDDGLTSAFSGTPWLDANYPVPTNDEFENAEQLEGVSGSVPGQNYNAYCWNVWENGEQVDAEPLTLDYESYRTVWYSWTAPKDGIAVFDASDATFDTILGVYKGEAIDELEVVSESYSAVSFDVKAGVAYRIAVGGYNNYDGCFTLAWNVVEPLANDNLANAQLIVGAEGAVEGTNVGATYETDEPLHSFGSSANTVWYSWTAPINGEAVFDTIGSDFDTVLGVYVGDAIDNLAIIVQNDDGGGSGTSRVSFTADAGVTYRIAVGGYGGNMGAISLHWYIDDGTFKMIVRDGVVTGFLSECPAEITAADWPNGVTNIASYAFRYCSNLESVTLPDGLESIGAHAFADCYYLETVTFEGGRDSVGIDPSAFDRTPWGRANMPFVLDMSEDGTVVYGFHGASPVTLDIPAGVTRIGDYAFNGLNSLRELVIPSSVTDLDYYAFAYCSGLEAALLPSTLEDQVTAKCVFDGDSGVEVSYYSVEDVTVTFDADGGTVAEPERILTAGTALGDLPDDPEREGHTFVGWLCEDGTAPSSSKLVVFDETITAQWAVNSYTLTFDTDGGTDVAPITQCYGTAVTAPAIPTRTGYTFAGWTPALPGTMPAGDATYTAQWTPNSYTLTFNVDGGSAVAPIVQNYGTAVVAPAAPTREGYTFVGWSPALPDTILASDATFTAQWTANRYVVTLDPDGGAFASGVSPLSGGKTTATLTYGSTGWNNPASRMPTRDGYAFIGFWTTKSGDGVQLWDSKMKYVGGTAYWSSNGTWKYANGLTVYARWVRTVVTLDPNGGAFGSSVKPITDGKTTATLLYGKTDWGTPTSRKPSRTGCVFNGFWTAKSGGTQVWDASMKYVAGTYWNANGTWKSTASALTVYARWTGGSYTVTLDPNGGKFASGVSPIKDGKTAMTVTCASTGWNNPASRMPTRDGYAFIGFWTTKSGDGTQVWNSGMKYVAGTYWAADGTWNYAGNLTVYARWARTTVTLDPNGGKFASGVSPITDGKTTAALLYGTTGWSNPGSRKPTRDGYAFIGFWTTASGSGVQVWDSQMHYVGGTAYWNANGTWKSTASALTVYARWARTTVTLDPNGGKFASSVSPITNGKTTAALIYGTTGWNTPASRKPTKSGYTFNGFWTATSGGTQIWDKNMKYVGGTSYWGTDGKWKSTASALTVYARWTSSNASSSRAEANVAGSAAAKPSAEPEGLAVVVTGTLDATFAKAQTVVGSLLDADGEPVGTVRLKVGRLGEAGTVLISATVYFADGGRASAPAVELAPAEDGSIAGILEFGAPVGWMAFAADGTGAFILRGDACYMDTE